MVFFLYNIFLICFCNDIKILINYVNGLEVCLFVLISVFCIDWVVVECIEYLNEYIRDVYIKDFYCIDWLF